MSNPEIESREELLRVATTIYASMVSSSVGGVDDLEVALPDASWAVEVAEGLIAAVNERYEPVGCCGDGCCEVETEQGGQSA